MTGSSLPIRPLTRRELIAIDCLVAVLLTAVYLTAASAAQPVVASETGRSWVISGLIVAFMGPPIAVRRLWPVPVFMVVTAVSVLAMSLGLLREPFVAAAISAYPAALAERRLSRRWWSILGSVSLVLLLLSVSAGTTRPVAGPFGALVPGAALVGAAWTLGVAVRERRAYAEWRVGDRLARAVADERLRIAREVHDIVTHNLGVITVQASVAQHVAQTQPDEALRSLRTIETVSRAALTDMRQVLHILRTRSQAPPGEDDSARQSPPDLDASPGLDGSPGLEDIPGLIQRAEAAGLDVCSEFAGAADVPAGVGRSAYRIVQESLTNVLKHAGPTRCHVTVLCAGDGVLIEVTDDGPACRRPASWKVGAAEGLGLLGIRERVSIHGGELHAGPRDRSGYLVRAHLPYQSGNPLLWRSS